MDWVLIGIVAGSLVTATFTSKEACMGRVSTLRDSKIEAKCVEAPKPSFSITNGGGFICLTPSGGGQPC